MLYLLRLLWRYAGPERPRVVAYYVLYLIATAIAVTRPVILDRLISALQNGGEQYLREVLFWCAVFGSTVFLIWLFHGPTRIIERLVAFGVQRRFVNDYFCKVTKMPLRWHQAHHSGDTIDRISKAGRGLFEFSQEQYALIGILVRYILSSAFLAWYCWWIGLATFLLSAIVIWVLRAFDLGIMRHLREKNEREHFLSAALFDYIGNILSVLTLRLEKRTQDEVDRRFGQLREPLRKEACLNEYKWFFLNVVIVLLQSGMIALYVLSQSGGPEPIQIGRVVAIFQYYLILGSVFSEMTMFINRSLRWQTDVMAIEPIEDAFEREGPSFAYTEEMSWHRLSIQGLNFSHDEQAKEHKCSHLKDISFSLTRGQRVALIGQSGAGKSTLLTLLRGLYQTESVRLSFDDKSYDHLAPLAGLTTLVPQDTELFENTIAYNLTFDVEVPKDLLWQALYMADIEGLIVSLPRGLTTDIRERGLNLSGGQKQRLALARGLLAATDSSLLLLDEVTSHVDMATEERIFDRIFSIYEDKTIIASVHRLHLVPRFDRIILMADGRVVQEGTFADLSQMPGPFRDLWRHHLRKDG